MMSLVYTTSYMHLYYLIEQSWVVAEGLRGHAYFNRGLDEGVTWYSMHLVQVKRQMFHRSTSS